MRSRRPSAGCVTVWAPISIILTMEFAHAIVVEAALSFLGLGEPPPTPTWGNILQDSQKYIRNAPWIAVFPGCAIAVSVLGLNLFGDAVRDAEARSELLLIGGGANLRDGGFLGLAPLAVLIVRWFHDPDSRVKPSAYLKTLIELFRIKWLLMTDAHRTRERAIEAK